MRLSLRWKITVFFTLLTAVVFALLDVTVQTLVSRHGEELVKESLMTQARLAQQVLPPIGAPSPRLQAKVTELDRLTQTRLTIIGTDGKVLADSREPAASMENHADRSERLQALDTGSGSAIRPSHTLHQDMLYVALAAPGPAGQPRPVLRLARALAEVRATSQRLRQAIWLGFAIAAALVWLVGLLLSNNIAAPIDKLVRVARRVNRGDLKARVEGAYGPDLAELSTVFNGALDSAERAVSVSQRESRYYAAILEQMSDAVIIVDAVGRVQFINPTFGRLFGLNSGGVAGRRSEEIALNYELSALLQRAVGEGTVQRDEVRLLYPESRILAATVTPLHDDKAAISGAIGLLRDMTESHRLDEMRREFVANASHELRTPTAAVKALAEALQMGALSDPSMGPRFVKQIVEAADRQTGILDDMLTLTRVEHGRELLNVTSLKAAEALQEAADQIQPAATAKGVDLRVEVGQADQVTADAGGLHTILLNLLDNAVKYTPRGGSVNLRGATAPGGYEITVTDTGPGIPPEHQSRIFERFYRVDKARDRATGGTGLGLSIVKHLAEAHGGRVSVRSVAGEGATFIVFIPGPV
jgi:two-component system, OmpR family, phosphate regulon sensor histidine kinase PhoR